MGFNINSRGLRSGVELPPVNDKKNSGPSRNGNQAEILPRAD